MASRTNTSTKGPRPARAGVPEAWKGFVRSHSAITRQMDADLIASHGLTLSDYEVLLHLSQASDQRMRRVDLAEGVLLTQSGITRLLAGLEQAGWVERVSCASDGRVVYAQLTNAGNAKFREAARTHFEGIRTLFADHFSQDELETLSTLLGRLPLRRGETECVPEDVAQP
jgi:DNA-binding MarR family transcriptional regulator